MGAVFVNQFGDVGGSAWSTWCAALAKYSPDQIKHGYAKFLASDRTYINLKIFQSLCDPYPEDYGLPDEDRAYRQVLHATRQRGSSDWSKVHPAVYWSYQQLDVYNWRMEKEEKARKQFCAIYKKAVESAMDGFVFPDTPKVLEAPKQFKSMRKEKAQSRMKDLLASVGSTKYQGDAA